MTFDDIWMVELQVKLIKCHDMSFNLIWWHLMTNGDI